MVEKVHERREEPKCNISTTTTTTAAAATATATMVASTVAVTVHCCIIDKNHQGNRSNPIQTKTKHSIT